jgi:glycosyltransferase involved in cell wall biosynthesis
MGLPAAGIEVIPVGIDPDEFAPPPADRPRDPDSVLVVTSADVPLKGLVHLLEALAKLRTERPARLTVVGSARPGGPAEAALDRLGLRDAVRFTGRVPERELVDLLQRAAVVAIPSLYEGFSLPAIEAMACAAPLVTTDAGALPEVVGTKAGLRVRAGDVGELTAALKLVLDSPALGEQLGRAGRRRVIENYTWRATAHRTADWYAEVLQRKGRPC